MSQVSPGVIQIRHPKLLRFVRFSTPLTLLLLVAFLTSVLLIENHAKGFYNRVSGGHFTNYLNGVFTWQITDNHHFSTGYLLFMRFAFDLHVIIVQGMNVLLNVNKDAPGLARLGSTQFDLLVVGNAVFDLVLLFTITGCLWRQVTAKAVKVVGLLFLTVILAIFGGFFAWIIVYNHSFAHQINNDASWHHPFLADKDLCVVKSLQVLWPLFGFILVALVLELVIDWIFLVFVCSRYSAPVPPDVAPSKPKSMPKVNQKLKEDITPKTVAQSKKVARPRPLIVGSNREVPVRSGSGVTPAFRARTSIPKPPIPSPHQKGLIAKVPVMKPIRSEKE